MDEFFRHLLDNSYYLPPAVAENLAAGVAGAYRAYWKNIGQEHALADLPRRIDDWVKRDRVGPEPQMPQDEVEYFSLYPAARKEAQNMQASDWVPWAGSLKLDINKSAKVGKHSYEINQGFINQFQRTAQDVRASQTVGDIERILVGSAVPISVFAAKEQAGKSQQPVELQGFVANFVSSATMKMYEMMPGFVKGKGSFEAWAGLKIGMGGMSADRNAELSQRPYGTASIEAMQGEDGDNDFVNDSGIDFGSAYAPGQAMELDRAAATAWTGFDPDAESIPVKGQGLLTPEQNVLNTVSVKLRRMAEEHNATAAQYRQWAAQDYDAIYRAQFKSVPNPAYGPLNAPDEVRDLYYQADVEEAKANSLYARSWSIDEQYFSDPDSIDPVWKDAMAGLDPQTAERMAWQAAYMEQFDARTTPSYTEQDRKARAVLGSSAQDIPLRYTNQAQRRFLKKKQIESMAGLPLPAPKPEIEQKAEAGQVWLTPQQVVEVAGFNDISMSEQTQQLVNDLDKNYRHQIFGSAVVQGPMTKQQMRSAPSQILRRQARKIAMDLVGRGGVGPDDVSNTPGLEAEDARTAGERQWHEKPAELITTPGAAAAMQAEGSGANALTANQPLGGRKSMVPRARVLDAIRADAGSTYRPDVYALAQGSQSIETDQSAILGQVEVPVYESYNLRSLIGVNPNKPLTMDELDLAKAIANGEELSIGGDPIDPEHTARILLGDAASEEPEMGKVIVGSRMSAVDIDDSDARLDDEHAGPIFTGGNEETENLELATEAVASERAAESLKAGSQAAYAYGAAVGQQVGKYHRVRKAEKSMRPMQRSNFSHITGAGEKAMEGVNTNPKHGAVQRMVTAHAAKDIPTISALDPDGAATAAQEVVTAQAAAPNTPYTFEELKAKVQEKYGDRVDVVRGNDKLGSSNKDVSFAYRVAGTNTIAINSGLLDREEIERRIINVGSGYEDVRAAQEGAMDHEVGHVLGDDPENPANKLLQFMDKVIVRGIKDKDAKKKKIAEFFGETSSYLGERQWARELTADAFAVAHGGHWSGLSNILLTEGEKKGLADKARRTLGITNAQAAPKVKTFRPTPGFSNTEAERTNVLISELTAKASGITGLPISARLHDPTKGSYRDGEVAYNDGDDTRVTRDFFDDDKVVNAISPKGKELSPNEARLVALIQANARRTAPKGLRDAVTEVFSRNYSVANANKAIETIKRLGISASEFVEMVAADLMTYEATGTKPNLLNDLALSRYQQDKLVGATRNAIAGMRQHNDEYPAPDSSPRMTMPPEPDFPDDLPVEPGDLGDVDVDIPDDYVPEGGSSVAKALDLAAHQGHEHNKAQARAANQKGKRIQARQEQLMKQHPGMDESKALSMAVQDIEIQDKDADHRRLMREGDKASKAKAAAKSAFDMGAAELGVNVDAFDETNSGSKPTAAPQTPEKNILTAEHGGGNGSKPPAPPTFDPASPEPEGGRRRRVTPEDVAANTNPRVSKGARAKSMATAKAQALQQRMRPENAYKVYSDTVKASGGRPLSKAQFEAEQSRLIGYELDAGEITSPNYEPRSKDQILADLRGSIAYGLLPEETLNDVAEAMEEGHRDAISSRLDDLAEEAEQREAAHALEAEALEDKQFHRSSLPGGMRQRGWNAAKAVNYLKAKAVVTPGSKAQGRTLGRAKWVDETGAVVQRESQASGVAFQKEVNGQAVTTLNQHEVEAVANQVSVAAGEAFKGPLPKDTGAMMSTLKDRMTKHIRDWLENLAKEVENNPNATPEQRADVKRLQANAGHLATKLIDQSLNGLGEEIGQGSKGQDSWKGIRAQKLKSEADIQAAMDTNPAFRAQVEQQYGSARNAASGAPMTMEADGQYYSFGDWRGSGQGQQRGGPGGWGGFMGGSFGQALYGAYIAKRALAMTVSPFIQEADWYSERIAQPAQMTAAIGNGGIPVGDTIAGTNVRSRLMQENMAKGAWQQFGGLSDAAYSMVGGSAAFGRLSAGLGLSAGVATLGALAGSPMAAGLVGPTLGAIAPAIAVPAAVGIGAGTLMMEGYNAIYPGEEPASWGNISRRVIGAYDYASAATQAAGKNGGSSALTAAVAGIKNFTGMVDGWIPGDQSAPRKWVDAASDRYRAVGLLPTEEQTLAEMTPEQRQIYRSLKDGSYERAEKVANYAAGLEAITGEDYATSQNALKLFGRATGDVLPYGDRIIKSVRENFGFGYGSNETASRFDRMREQLGYLPGQAGAIFDKWSASSPIEQFAMEGRGEQIGRFGGTLAPYYSDPNGGQRLADRWNLNTQVKAKGVGDLLASAGEFGVEADQMVSVRNFGLGTAGVSSVPMGDYAAFLSQQYGSPFKAEIGAKIGTQLQAMGVGQTRALAATLDLGIDNQSKTSVALSYLQGAEQFGSTVDPMAILAASQAQNPWQTMQLGGIAQHISVTGGMDYGMALQAVSGKGLSDQQVSLLTRGLNGDMGAWTQIARQTGNMAYAFQNNAGMPVYTTDMMGYMGFMDAQGRSGNPYAATFIPNMPNMDDQVAARYGLDTAQGQRTVSALMGRSYSVNGQPIGGTMGLQWDYMQQQQEFQNRGIALQEKQMTADWNYTIKSWDMQSQQREMQYNFQQMDFTRQGVHMEMQNTFAERGEGIQLARMQAGQEFAERGEQLSWQRIELNEKYGGQVAQLGRERMLLYHENQLWGLQFGHQTELMQRDFTREGWEYQDTMRGLQNAWNMEDIDENIRYATGRQRRQLIKQRDRMATTQNMEGEEIDRQRSNQEKLWAKEDERYKVQEAFLRKIIELDKQQQDIAESMRLESIELEKEQWRLSKEQRMAYYKFDMEQYNLQVEQRKAFYKFEQEELARKKSEYEAMWVLENNRITAARQHQIDMHHMAVDNLQLQKDQTAAAQTYQQTMTQITNEYALTEGYWKTMLQNDPTPILKALTDMATTVGGINANSVQKITGMVQQLATANNITALQLVLQIVQELTHP